ncbi:MAG: arginine--tRNA ligase [Candidatus Saccharimonadales bacterium]
MKDQLQELISQLIQQLYNIKIDVEIDRPSEEFGDYSTNVALKLANTLKKSPSSIANEIVDKLKTSQLIQRVSVADPGFINLTLTDSALVEVALSVPSKTLDGQEVVAEYSDPNPFKILHAGHLYTSVVGEAIANLLAKAGANVHRVNFGGDVGLHVAKNIWAIIQELGGENPDKLSAIKESDRSGWLSKCYVRGNEAYETNEQAKDEIRELNKRLYNIALEQEKESDLARIYWVCRTWSYDYFSLFYKRLNIQFEKYYPESEVADIGTKTINQHTPDVYTESQGAIVFVGEKYGLYTNVFINREGLPTYAAKDVGLIFKKWQDYHYDKSVIITANEQADYMKVVLKSVEQFAPEMALPTIHLTHGIVKLVGGRKMSSRDGNFVRAEDILDLAEEVTRSKNLNADPRITSGAVKYSFLKQRIGADIIYDANESVSIEGNSGPYLQYAYARAKSIINKSEDSGIDLHSLSEIVDSERSLIRKIGEFSETVDLAVRELMPHHLAVYLYDLAQTFNRFYENNRVIGDKRQALRVSLVRLYAQKLAEGLEILGIEPIESI